MLESESSGRNTRLVTTNSLTVGDGENDGMFVGRSGAKVSGLDDGRLAAMLEGNNNTG